MIVETLPLQDLLLLKPKVFGDERGYFFESYSQRTLQDHGFDWDFKQDNISFSERGVLRGLHFQRPFPQGKLVSALVGEVFDVVVDMRKSSSTFGKSYGVQLSQTNKHQLWVPPGFAHGFVVTSPTAIFHYKVTEFYMPEHEQCLMWNDPKLGIEWPKMDVKLSAKDKLGKSLDVLVKISVHF